MNDVAWVSAVTPVHIGASSLLIPFFPLGGSGRDDFVSKSLMRPSTWIWFWWTTLGNGEVHTARSMPPHSSKGIKEDWYYLTAQCFSLFLMKMILKAECFSSSDKSVTCMRCVKILHYSCKNVINTIVYVKLVYFMGLENWYILRRRRRKHIEGKQTPKTKTAD